MRNVWVLIRKKEQRIKKIEQLSIMMAVFFGAHPAFRFNLFIFKEKIKRIFTSIGARGFSIHN